MARKSQKRRKTKQQLECESLELWLLERRVRLVLAGLLGLASTIEPFIGVYWPVSAGTVAVAVLSAFGSVGR